MSKTQMRQIEMKRKVVRTAEENTWKRSVNRKIGQQKILDLKHTEKKGRKTEKTKDDRFG